MSIVMPEDLKTATRDAAPPEADSRDRRADQPCGASDAARVAAEAYAIYEQRGRRDGYDVDDWLKAERRVAIQAR